MPAAALRRFGLLLFAVLASCAAYLPVAQALEVPRLSGRVNDLGELLSPEVRGLLTQSLEEYEKQTGHQFAVLTVKSLEGEPIEMFSLRVVEEWKLGKAKRDDGVLLLVAVEDRAMRLEVGYGLEGDLPDAKASRIIRDEMVPRFRRGDMQGGILAAADAVMRLTGGSGLGEGAPVPAVKPSQPSPWLHLLPWLFILLPLLFSGGLGRRRGGFWAAMFLAGMGRGSHRSSGGGGFGGGGFGGGGGGFGGGGASGRW